MSVRRVLAPAEMTARDLSRRRIALALLTALPLALYGAQAGHLRHAVVTGGVVMAFSVAGAAMFASFATRPVDQRLMLAGYRPYELLLGRLLLLEVLGVLVAALFSVVMTLGTGPSDTPALVGGVALVAFTSVPFGLALGALAPQELEGTLILIGVVGIQLTTESSQLVAKLLPFWGPQRLLTHSIDTTVAIGAAVPVDIAYSLALLLVAVYAIGRRAPAISGAAGARIAHGGREAGRLRAAERPDGERHEDQQQSDERGQHSEDRPERVALSDGQRAGGVDDRTD